MKEKSKGEIVIYKAPDGSSQIDVRLEEETVWLTQVQMVSLFQTTKQNISLHVNNVFKEGELSKNSVVKEYLTTASDGKTYRVKGYNLDVIISVGYRVKSKRGTQFRIWANKILKDYLVKGYSLNEKRLKEQSERVQELEKTLEIFTNVIGNYQLKQDEFSGILKVITDYAFGLKVLDEYDNQALEINSISRKKSHKINYKKAKKIIEKMKEQFSSSQLFGKEKDESFRVQLQLSINHLMGRNHTQVLKKRRHIFYILQ